MRLQILSAVTLSLAAGGMASCAPAPADMDGGAPARACFYPDSLVNFRNSGDNIAYVRVGRNEVFELRASGFCPGLSSTRRLAISEATGMGSRVCTGDFVGLVVTEPGAGGEANIPCRAQVARKLTAEEVAALPERERP